MRAFGLAAALASLYLIGTSAIHLVDRGAHSAVVSLNIQRRAVADPVARDKLRRRSKSSTVVLDNEKNLYFANASLGTPPQPLRFHLDTGSSDLWTNTPSSSLCRSRRAPCAESGTFVANRSSTYRYLNSDFRITYADQSGASGDYAVDTITIAGNSLPGLQFGIGYRSTSGECILGIGYAANQAQVARGTGKPYPNVPELMVRAGLIQSNAYSLWLNDLDASTGSILFGGVNTEKYVGQLSSLPIQKRRGSAAPSEFVVTLTELSFNTNGTDDPIATGRSDPVLLDSGSSLTYLPTDVAVSIIRSVGGQYDSRSEVALVPCALASSKTTLNFKFTTPVIAVPMDELVIRPTTTAAANNANNNAAAVLTMADGRTPACLFGISPAGERISVLGDTFLRSAYVVYDLENHEIALAQTSFNATADRILEIGRGRNAVPDASRVRDPVVALSTGNLRAGRPGPVSSVVLPSGSATLLLTPPQPTGAPPRSAAASTTAALLPRPLLLVLLPLLPFVLSLLPFVRVISRA